MGIDIAEEAIARLGAWGVEGRAGRFEEIAWRDELARIVLMTQVIEHLENPVASLARARGILAPGGVLVVETPSLDGWDARLFCQRYWGGWHSPRHFTLFTEASQAAAVRQASKL